MEVLKGTKSNCVITYVPHGINPDVFKPVNVPNEFVDKLFSGRKFKFVLFWMNRNIKRKQPSDVMWAYAKFVDSLPEEERKDCCLLMHTNPIDNNGTDLVKVKEAICPDYTVLFSMERITPEQLNYLYNVSDVTINIAGNEGFGLTTAESIMTETPVIVNVTGGLQDQCGFTLKGKEFTADDYKKIGSLHEYKKWEKKVKHGVWVKPVWSKVQTLVGSVPTPYIIDDKVDVDDVAEAIKYWYDKTPLERREAGKVGREWMLGDSGLNSSNMCQQMASSIERTIENWTRRERYKIYKIR
jgi:glycosyltransferase involved in cell wall biosynthesis